jgi:two-component system CheB/CheR fusion protein
MPRNAIASGLVDFVLPAAAMAAQIEAYWATSRRMRLPEEAAPSPEQREEGPEPEAALQDILAHVRVQTGHDFTRYKRATVLRRLGRRMQVSNLESLPDYLAFLGRHHAEVDALVGDLLISVTQFFRDPATWEALERDVLPRLFRGMQGEEDDVRAWVCGCATGEEAYTLAILLLEEAARRELRPRVQVFATDVDAEAITQAREGIYPETISADVSEERLRRWFYRHRSGAYQIRKEVREIVLFASHDLLKDTPFSRLDLVSCRNVLIYLNRDAQDQAFQTFHFALRRDGTLLLGPSESAEGASPLFGPSSKERRLYVRRPAARSTMPPRALPAGRGSPAVRVLIEAIRTVAQGGLYLDPTMTAHVVHGFLRQPVGAAEAELSERETEVLRLIAQGYSNKEIAARLELSVKTVETYKARSMDKLGLGSRVDIVRYAVQRGWLDG